VRIDSQPLLLVDLSAIKLENIADVCGVKVLHRHVVTHVTQCCAVVGFLSAIAPSYDVTNYTHVVTILRSLVAIFVLLLQYQRLSSTQRSASCIPS
jgi:hypothetical protein